MAWASLAMEVSLLAWVLSSSALLLTCLILFLSAVSPFGSLLRGARLARRGLLVTILTLLLPLICSACGPDSLKCLMKPASMAAVVSIQSLSVSRLLTASLSLWTLSATASSMQEWSEARCCLRILASVAAFLSSSSGVLLRSASFSLRESWTLIEGC